MIARGLGRCYGDSSLGDNVVSTLRFNRMLAFDGQTGILSCEAGLSLGEILEVFVSRGWFLPVTPGTKFVTVGGAIASDVHGKNHHLAGSFSNHVLFMDVLLASGEIVRCSKKENADLFWATCGGMGLTGIIISASIGLIPITSAYIVQETVKARNLDEIMSLFEESVHWTYSVAWIDCLATGFSQGRSILMRGKHADKENLLSAGQVKTPLLLPNKRTWNVPMFFPNFALNSLSVRTFNMAYFAKAPTEVFRSIIDYDQFFYPLDALHNWNRIYGRRGFTQYQFVLPKESSREGLQRILSGIATSGMGSFLAVLKLFGNQDNLLSFPTEGYTLALDFPITDKLFPFLNGLDSILLDYGGRIYLTKDARMSADVFKKGYKKLDDFLALKKKFDSAKKFQSRQSNRLGI